jgi:hypothetical protein
MVKNGSSSKTTGTTSQSPRRRALHLGSANRTSRVPCKPVSRILKDIPLDTSLPRAPANSDPRVFLGVFPPPTPAPKTDHGMPDVDEGKRSILARMPFELRGAILDFGPSHRDKFSSVLAEITKCHGLCGESRNAGSEGWVQSRDLRGGSFCSECGKCHHCEKRLKCCSDGWIECANLSVLVCPDCAMECERCERYMTPAMMSFCGICRISVCRHCGSFCETCMESRCREHGVVWHCAGRKKGPFSDCDECR